MTALMRRLAPRLGLVDHPNLRKVHVVPTPLGGGLAILRAIERVGFDVFNRRPELTKLDYLKLGWNAIRGRVES